jgi:hypothetical protein
LDELFELYQTFLAARLQANGAFTSIGEDSIRYSFYIALMSLYGLEPHQIILEQAISDTQFLQRERNIVELRQGRHQDKPEFDLRIDPVKGIENGVLAEFAFFRTLKIGKVEVSGAYGKILNEIHPLALLKHYRNIQNLEEYVKFSNYKCLLICVTYSLMLNYGNGARGIRPAYYVQDQYHLSNEFLSPPQADGIIGSIENKFRHKTQQLNIIPTAQRIYNRANSLENPKWGVWVWEVNFTNEQCSLDSAYHALPNASQHTLRLSASFALI